MNSRSCEAVCYTSYLYLYFVQLENSGKLVVSGCSADCSLQVWDVETGNHLTSVGPDGHGPRVELTAAALDPTGHRLATAAEDGSIKV